MDAAVSDDAPQADQPSRQGVVVTATQEDAVPRSITIPRGVSLLGLLRSIYGSDLGGANARELIAEVRRLNPRMQDPNVILAGDALRLPHPPGAPSGPEPASVP